MPYYKFVPKFRGTFHDGKFANFDDCHCFDSVAISSKIDGALGPVNVTFDIFGEKANPLCSESFIISTGAETLVKSFRDADRHVVTLSPQTDNEANQWDLYKRGPRVFQWPLDLDEVVSNLAATAELYESHETESVSPRQSQLNREFLSSYAGIEMPPRTHREVLKIDTSLIRSGDTFEIMRLDGDHAMIAWALGAATGHVAVAMRTGETEDDLFICESTVLSAYWPIANGIQCNPYNVWIEQAKIMDDNVVWAPLSPENREKFNEHGAWDYIDAVLGNDYGWEVVVMGLLDMYLGSDICADNAREMCMEPETWEMFFHVAEKQSEEAARSFKPAMMVRAGVDFDEPMIEAYYKASEELGIAPAMLHEQPELDEYRYESTKYGQRQLLPSAVCNVFTCNVWKAGGLFGQFSDTINCGEFRLGDNYKLHVFDDNFERPQACVEADPENPLCQLVGDFSLRIDAMPGVLPRYNYVELHEHFAEHCPSKAPDYVQPDSC